MRWTNTRWSGTSASASCAVLPTTGPPFLHAERAQLELVPGRAGTAGFLLAAVLLLISLARGLEIDAEQRRAEQREDDRRADRAEDVGDGVGDRHRIQQSSWSRRATGQGD